ncbi:MAG: HBL/NHE enterotoxin family protein [Jatrophihabitantaceae bacterium]
MQLAAIVAAAPTQQALLDYQNSCATVNQYAFAITNTSLPVLNQPPANYGNFAAQFAPAKAHCLEWTTGIFPTMLSFPQTIVNQSADLFNLEDTMASAWLDALISNPNNDQAKQGLAKALTAMQAIVQAQLATAQGLVNSMNTFTGDITADANTLNTLAAEALADAGQDQTTITNLNADIDSLKNQISTLNTLLTLSEIGIGLSIFVGLIGAVCCFIPGAQGIGVGLIVIAVAGEAASITGTVLLNKEIDAKNQAIQEDQVQITQLNQDIVALQATNKQFVWLQQANVDAQAALATVVQMWQDLDNELTTVQKDLTTVGTDVTSAQYQQAQDDLTAAAAAWADVVAFATALAGVSYNWQDSSGNWHNYTATAPAADNATVAMLPSSQAA